MSQLRTARSASFLLAISTILGCGGALAANPDTYLSGTFMVTAADSSSDFTQLILTFDGAGNASGTKTDNNAGVITTGSVTGTYTVSADGVLTFTDSHGNVQTAQLSPDGNSFTGVDIESGQSPDGFFGVRQGPVALLNTPLGLNALQSDTTGYNNVATGYQALFENTAGYNNTAFGFQVLYSNTSGAGNAGQGSFALEHNTTGNQNTALGNHALQFNNGSQNTVLGFEAGYLLTGGSNNIDIGSPGGAPKESNTIRIGTTAATASGTALTPQTAAYVAGIAGTTLTGAAVYVTSSGQLGVLASSERYKTDITPLGTRTESLQQLRPVSFRLRNDASGTLQYGLIAEEVAKVYPELVIRGDDGRINGVRYEELTPLLLNEVQQQHEQLAAQASQLAAQNTQLTEVSTLKQQLAAQGAQLAELKALVATLMPQAKDQRVALR